MVRMISLLRIAFIIIVVTKTKSEVVESVKFKSGLLFPEVTTVGYYVAFAIPLDLPKRSVFCSAGFEQYFSLPFKPYHWFPPDYSDGRSNSGNDTTKNRRSNDDAGENSAFDNSLTRTRAYELIETNLDLAGIDGISCLLRTICEVNATPLVPYNGVYGNLLQVIFTPSSSEDEGLDDEYYKAERYGKKKKCKRYHEDCPISLYEMFTKEYDINW